MIKYIRTFKIITQTNAKEVPMIKRNISFILMSLFIICILFLVAAMLSKFVSPSWAIRLYYFAIFISVLLILAIAIREISTKYFAILFFGVVLASGIMVILFCINFANIFGPTLEIVFNWPILISGLLLSAMGLLVSFSRGGRDSKIA